MQRVVIDAQWTATTDAAMYLEDLRRAVRHDEAEIVLCRQRPDHIALAIAPTGSVVPESRRGLGSQALLVVVYSADWGRLLSGYQASSRDKIRIAEDAIWLR